MTTNERFTLSFTGSQYGMTPEQFTNVKRWLRKHAALIIHVTHGGCVGADDEFHELCIRYGIPTYVRPCTITSKQGDWYGAMKVFPEKAPLDRNPDIVNDGKFLVACPATMEEVLRSGTWATIRYARRKGVKIFVFWPNGKIDLDYS